MKKKVRCSHCGGTGREVRDYVDSVWSNRQNKFINIRRSEVEYCVPCKSAGFIWIN